MIKGVNKRIVEINYTRDAYIEKAILILKPDKSQLPETLLSQKADSYMQSLRPGLPPPAKKRRLRHSPYFWGALLAITLAAGLLLTLGLIF